MQISGMLYCFFVPGFSTYGNASATNFSSFNWAKKRPTLAIHRKTPGRAKRAFQGLAKSRKFQSTSGALVNWSGFGVIQGTRVGSGVASGSAK